MRLKERRDTILQLVAQEGSVAVDVLAETLKVSRETVRRDLTLLSEQNLLRKVHGGAVRNQAAREDPFAERMQKNRAAKLRIGAAAAALFDAGDSIFIDTGSTTIYLAEFLANKAGLTIITNAQKVAQAIVCGSGGSEAYLLGGRYSRENEQVLGPVTVEQVQRFNADHAVLTVGAIDSAARFMDYNAEEAYVARSMIERASCVTILADSSKFNRTALFEICDGARIDRIVTDIEPSSPIASALATASVEVILA